MDVEVEVVTIDAVDMFDRLLFENKRAATLLRRIISSELSKARTRISKDAKQFMDSDPRQAYRAVKRSIYKRIFGGQLSILSKRRAGSTRVRVDYPRKLDQNPHQRGGNRRSRSERTEQIDSYFGSDRGFILRFVNSGTDDRMTRYGNRGRIGGRNWFGIVSQSQMEMAASQIGELVEEALIELSERV